ncbi:(2Fe-2S)-binding protein [Rhodoferax sp. BAB1]|uniref:(2Fe-2S)-binding protein n=1 Tax=Rhodoferax sp. BAB1 TaxID=2741720 RepID=UPI001576AF58|nr:(2Fe-2S)-binding protein [Rhodoferax sp. BAB1]QKO21811.1 (2Fe-2S)-binding protein [Rhodoferax sp. BAB1]
MDRRQFVETCSTSVACLTAAVALPSFAADAKPKTYARVLLTNEFGDPIKASQLQAQTNYVFHYPFEATPVFLLKLDKPAAPQPLATRAKDSYVWPGGVGPQRNLVAFSAICAHQLVYPTQQVSFISFRKSKAKKGVADNLIHCCAEHSQYDPAQGARVLNGPAEQPLCAVLLEHDAKADTLTAYATLGGELFDEFFRKYEFKLSLDVGPKAKNAVAGKAAVRELEKFCRNPIQC